MSPHPQAESGAQAELIRPVPEDPYVSRNFAHLLGVLEDGELNSDLTESLKKLMAEMERKSHQTDKPVTGEITLTLAIKYQEGVSEIVPAYKVKAPPSKRRKTVMWRNADNDLSLQRPLPLGGLMSVRSADSTTGGRVVTAL